MRGAALLLATVLLAGCASPTEPTEGPPTRTQPSSEGGAGPAWSFQALDGQTYSRDSPEGNATVLFFMATWCGTCASKAPAIAEVADEYAPKGVRTFSIDFDPSETPAEMSAWQERYQQDWPHALDKGATIQRTFEVCVQSTVVVLDADGELVKKFGYGQVTADLLRDALDSALSA